jgi:hypothetical protein
VVYSTNCFHPVVPSLGEGIVGIPQRRRGGGGQLPPSRQDVVPRVPQLWGAPQAKKRRPAARYNCIDVRSLQKFSRLFSENVCALDLHAKPSSSQLDTLCGGAMAEHAS